MVTENKVKPVLITNFFEQKKTIETLNDESRADGDFFLFLAASTIITALGLILNSSVIVIGGMLVAPLLFPILSLGMSVATSSRQALMRALRNLTKSTLLVFLLSLFISFLFHSQLKALVNDINTQNHPMAVIELASIATLAHFLIAFVSGIIASFAWVKQNLNASLPGIAVSVSLLPPLAAIGVGLSILNEDIAAGALLLYLINLLGIFLASAIVFSLFGFSNLHRVQQKVVEEEKKEAEAKAEQKAVEQAAETIQDTPAT